MVEWRRLVSARRSGERGSPEAAAHLREGERRYKRGDRAGAIEAYRRADDAGSAEGASILGALLFEAGDVRAAHAALVRADERGSVMGTFRLGFLLQSIERLDEAEDAYRRAAERGNKHATKNLALLREDRARAGRRNAAEAEALFTAAREQGVPVLRVRDADELAVGLAQVELDQGRPERAEEILREALANGTRNVGAVLARRGATAEARRYYLVVIESGHRVYGPQATRRLEELG